LLQDNNSHITFEIDYKAGYKACFMLLFIVLLTSCSTSVRFSSAKWEKSDGRTELIGKASYYGDEFHGRQTANGEIYDRSKISAAHKTLPFGTILKVKNLRNNREIIVRINDRGPFVAGRIIDLSYSAAKELDMIRDGVIDVELTIIE